MITKAELLGQSPRRLGETSLVRITSTNRRLHYEMGISFSSLVCGEPEPEEVTVEHGDSVPNSKAIHAAIASGLAAASGSRNEELQAKRFDPRPSNPRSLKLLKSP